MRYILVILSVLFYMSSNAQGTYTPDATKKRFSQGIIAFGGVGDTANFKNAVDSNVLIYQRSNGKLYFRRGTSYYAELPTTDVLSGYLLLTDTTAMLSTKVGLVNNVNELQNYSGSATAIFVKDSLRGGLFYYVTSGLTSNNGTIFSATGKGSGVWQRVYNQSDGLNVLWFGADPTGVTGSTYAINSAIGLNKNIIIPPGSYSLDSAIRLKNNTNIIATGASFLLKNSANAYMITNDDLVNGNKNISVTGGIWNGNGHNQSLDTVGKGPTNAFYGWGFHFYKCNTISVQNVEIDSTFKWGIAHLLDTNVVFRNIYFQQSYSGLTNNDGITGSSSNVIIDNVWGFTNDDMIGILTTPAFVVNGYPVDNLSNWNVSNIRADYHNPVTKDKATLEAVRVLTYGNKIASNINISNVSGVVKYRAVQFIGVFDTTGYINNATVSNVNVSIIGAVTTGSQTSALIQFLNCRVKNSSFTGINRVEKDYSSVPTFSSINSTVDAININNSTSYGIGQNNTFFRDSISTIVTVNMSNIVNKDSAGVLLPLLYYKYNTSPSNTTTLNISNITSGALTGVSGANALLVVNSASVNNNTAISGALTVTGTITNELLTSTLVKTNTVGAFVPAIANVDYLTVGNNTDTTYILWSGQSNANGSNTDVSSTDTSGSWRVQGWDGSTWVRAALGALPFSCISPFVANTVTPYCASAAFYFAQQYSRTHNNCIVRIYVMAWNGKAITNWVGPTGIGTTGNYLTYMDSVISSSITPNRTINIVGWQQGENDNTNTNYKRAFDSLSNAVHYNYTWSNSVIPIIVGGPVLPAFATINNQLIALSRSDTANVFYGYSDSLTTYDANHFTALGQSVLARRMMQAYQNSIYSSYQVRKDLTVTGNITGTLSTAAQPSITSLGTLTGLTVTAPINGSVTGSAATVTAAAQPTITSVGSLTGLTVNGNTVMNGVTSIVNTSGVSPTFKITSNTNGFTDVPSGTTMQIDAQDGQISNIYLNAFGGGNGSVFGSNASGTSASKTATVINRAIAIWGGRGYGTTGWLSPTGQIRVTAAEAFTDASAATYLDLFTTNFGSVTATRRGRIAPAGELLMNKTTPSGNGNEKIQVTGSVNASDTVTASKLSGTLVTAAQPNITSVGTLTSLTVTNNITANGLILTGLTGAITRPAGVAADGSITTTGVAVPSCLQDFTAIANNSGTSETDLMSYTTVASQLANTGDKIIAKYYGVYAGLLTATRTIQFYFAGNSIFNTGAITMSTTGAFTIEVMIMRISGSQVQYSVQLTTPTASTSVYSSNGTIGGLTFSNTFVAKITGQSTGTGAASGDVSANIGTINYIPKAN